MISHSKKNKVLLDQSSSDTSEDFKLVGFFLKKELLLEDTPKHFQNYIPIVPSAILIIILLGCLCSSLFINHDASEYYLYHLNEAPNKEFWFGTDSLGRDIFSIIWTGGRFSLFIGIISTACATFIGVIYGCVAGSASDKIDALMMRIVELMQSIPTLLTLLFILSLLGQQTIISLSLVIGGTSWLALARIVRSEVKQIRKNEYILVSRHMGASFPWVIHKHILPNIISATMFVIISSIGTNIAMESTLSFIGMGLPQNELSWGSMLALANRALLLNTWWVIVIPGFFLVVTLLCITSIGHSFRKEQIKGSSNL